jgi:hypothetical protein
MSFSEINKVRARLELLTTVLEKEKFSADEVAVFKNSASTLNNIIKYGNVTLIGSYKYAIVLFKLSRFKHNITKMTTKEHWSKEKSQLYLQIVNIHLSQIDKITKSN